MSRRGDPERIFEAQKAGVRNRLIGNGMQRETADLWLDAWVPEATGRELPRCVAMAPPDGFEPPTPALGRLRSIH